MLRLPRFTYRAPGSIQEALEIRHNEGPSAMYVAGGTDLLPNMKRRHQEPQTVISLRNIPQLNSVTPRKGKGTSVGALTTLTCLIQQLPGAQYEAVRAAAASISTPLLRNMGTIGGNLCLDTRCNYYNQSYEWRKSINFCMKKDGDTCWVAPGSPRCWAVNSSDLAPVMVAIGAEYQLAGTDGTRTVRARDFYRNDGIDYLALLPGEILTHVVLPEANGCDVVYLKLRRRGSFDFPVLGVAACIRWDGDKVAGARVVLGGVASYPQFIDGIDEILKGSTLDNERIDLAARAAFKPSKPMDNTDFGLAWRKEMTFIYVKRALTTLRSRHQRR